MEGLETGKSEIWNIVAPVVEREGFRVFDIELPGQKSGILRVFIWKGKNEGILLDDCARVSRGLADIAALDEAIAGPYVLEVSSPGINRKLIRPDHFTDAVGERVKVVVDNTILPKGVVKGVLQSFNGQELDIADEEEDQEKITLPFSAVKRANVDFKFGNKRE